MGKFTGAVAAPIAAGLLVATVGCGAAAAATTSTPTVRGAASASVYASAPFPGIWDITSWSQYRAAQAAVEQGHQPWLLDAKMVVSAWAAQQGMASPTVRQTGSNTYQVTQTSSHAVYTIHVTCPAPGSAAPIWVITSISH